MFFSPVELASAGNLCLLQSLLMKFTFSGSRARLLFTITSLLCAVHLMHGQVLRGTLTDDAGQLLLGGTILALPTGTGTTADIDGAWQLDATGADSLRFAYVGYEPQTLAVTSFGESRTVVLAPRSLDVVTVSSRKLGNYTSTLDPRNVESITSTELKKAPCCNLGESFETNAAVDVSYRDAATGAREMQVLGLRGIYSQLLVEKRPTLYGLATPIALDLIAGTWLDGIQIGKGASSVQTGPNALAGQINTELIKPWDTDPLHVNLFASGLGRVEANVHLAKPWTDAHSTGLLLHSSYNAKAHDRDQDGFLEQPGRETFSAMGRHFYRTDNWRAQVNVWGARDRREGGQFGHGTGENVDHGEHHGGGRYVLAQANDRFEAFAKTGYLGFARPATSIGIIGGLTQHSLDNRYGSVTHDARQRSGYLSALFTSYLGNTNHTYTVGVSHQYDDYDEVYDESNYDRTEYSTGAFAEYTYDYLRGSATGSGLSGLSIIAGLRVDEHNVGGLQALPRLNVKVNPSEALALRASAGRAYRSPQVIAENIRLLASSRSFVIEEPLQLATGWNYGVALTQNFELSGKQTQQAGRFKPSGSFSLDAYATVFDNLAVVDQDRRVGFTTVANATGPARTFSILGSVRIEPLRGLGIKAAYKHVDSRQTYADGVERTVPYVAAWRGLLAGDYEVPSKRWRFNTHLQLVGPMRLPGEDIFPLVDVRVAEPIVFESPVYALLSAQATHIVNDRVELYAGAENLTNYRQTRAVLGATNDANYFDASRVYAPLMGIMPYAGLRYTLAK